MPSKLILSRQKGCIIAFYDAKRKNIIEFGSNTVGNHKILRSTHAEENALRAIYLFLARTIGANNKIKYAKYISNIKIFIWKQNNSYEIKPVYCCEWCIKTINRYNFPIGNVITVNANYATYCNTITCNINENSGCNGNSNNSSDESDGDSDGDNDNYIRYNVKFVEIENIVVDLKISNATMHTHVVPNPLLKRNVKKLNN